MFEYFFKINRKHLCWSLCRQLQAGKLFKKSIDPGVILVNFEKFFRITVSKSPSRWLLLYPLHSACNWFEYLKTRRVKYKISRLGKVLLEVFWNIHSKTPVKQTLFNKVSGFTPATLLKWVFNKGVFLLFLRDFGWWLAN